MACTRGCCSTQKEHYRSIRIAGVDRKQMAKTTVDVHDQHKVEVKEHFNDRVDVTVKVPTVAVTTTQNEVY